MFTKSYIKNLEKKRKTEYFSNYEKQGVIFERMIVVTTGAIFGFILDRIIPFTGVLLTITFAKFGKIVYNKKTKKSFNPILEWIFKPFVRF